MPLPTRTITGTLTDVAGNLLNAEAVFVLVDATTRLPPTYPVWDIDPLTDIASNYQVINRITTTITAGALSVALSPNDRHNTQTMYFCHIILPSGSAPAAIGDFYAALSSGASPIAWVDFYAQGTPLTAAELSVLNAHIADETVHFSVDNQKTAAAWTAANTVLGATVIGVETDTKLIKIGDGATAWNSLTYWRGKGGSHTINTTGGNITLTASQGLAAILRVTGNLVSPVVITVPATMDIFVADNATNGAHTVSFKISGQVTPYVVDVGHTAAYTDPVEGVESLSSVGAGAGDMVLASTQTISGAKTFLNATFYLRNIANTFSGVFSNAITAARTWTFPDKDGTVAMLSDMPLVNDFRLTLESGVPVSVTDQVAKTEVFVSPFTGNRMTVWDGSGLVTRSSGQYSIALGTLTAGLPYDIYAYDNAGVLAGELLAWTNGTTRATEWSWQNGLRSKVGDPTRRLLGTLYTTSTTTTEDSKKNRLLRNVDNRVARDIYALSATASYNYTVDTYRLAGNSTDNQASFVISIPGDVAEFTSTVTTYNTTAGGAAYSTIGYDSTTIPATGATVAFVNLAASLRGVLISNLKITPAVGYHTVNRLEAAIAVGTQTWAQNSAGSTVSPLIGIIRG